ncbi:alpha/beta hydrolase [Actinosynnema pretiosum subsp. pretiosum]|uniref:Alpha/beta hydrolase fold protein n=2 Tax=Actinosynnema TaxID=40566 RepID=C6WH84_ACTMD|nr:alpha/beta hydrolase [Actinosynnema mirum]ACU38003.1 alpha/beta hydrolase fold protein [Actinosynnema mirum DSM 43827]AXX31497.1 Non-heme chloroperoxidase [Actinosynnema pretiosum subsp. pretiosum]QUF04469.1 alpha/beta hydrolase [Actinosynnema pretiosum subsp. pretiosum]
MAEITAHHGLFKDTNLHVDDTGGPGRPVVLIHGWPLSGESWKLQVPALAAAGHRVITYDRRGFGRSDKPRGGYEYDTLAEDLHHLLAQLELTDVVLVGFSMGGGEVARYVAKYGQERLRGVVFASAVPPYLARTADNPEGPLPAEKAEELAAGLKDDESTFYDTFVTDFFSVDGELKVTQEQWREARALCDEADHRAAQGCMAAWAGTDFRADLPAITVPTLVIHGDSDATVPYEGSGERVHAAIPGSQAHVVAGGPHGVNVSHAEEWNRVVLEFLAR